MIAKLGFVGVTLSVAILSASVQPTTPANAAPRAITDDEMAAIALNVGMPHMFQEMCKTFKPTYELSEENTQKYLISALSSFNLASMSRTHDALKDNTIAEKWGRELAERHKNDPDPIIGACEEILRRVGPNGTDAKGLLVEAAGPSSQSPAAIEADHRELGEAEAAIPAQKWQELAAAFAHEEEQQKKRPR